MSNEISKRYAQRGVSASKEDVHKAISKVDKGLFPKAFCKIVPDYLTHDEDYCLVMHADGAGTKSSLAYMYWKATGDLSVWKGKGHSERKPRDSHLFLSGQACSSRPHHPPPQATTPRVVSKCGCSGSRCSM